MAAKRKGFSEYMCGGCCMHGNCIVDGVAPHSLPERECDTRGDDMYVQCLQCAANWQSILVYSRARAIPLAGLRVIGHLESFWRCMHHMFSALEQASLYLILYSLDDHLL